MQPRHARRIERLRRRQIHVKHHRLGHAFGRSGEDVLKKIRHQAAGRLGRGLPVALHGVLDILADGGVVDVHQQDRVAPSHEHVAAHLERRVQHLTIRLADERLLYDGDADHYQDERPDGEGDQRPQPVEADLQHHFVRGAVQAMGDPMRHASEHPNRTPHCAHPGRGALEPDAANPGPMITAGPPGSCPHGRRLGVSSSPPRIPSNALRAYFPILASSSMS